MHRLFLCVLAFGLFATDLRAQSSWPLLNSTSPCAVQVGTTTECELSATYGNVGAYDVMVYGRGVAGEVLTAAPASALSALTPTRTEGKIKVRFTVTADAPLGIRDVRLLTPNGPSSVGQIVVVRDPIVREVKANNSMKEAQAVALPATLCGAVEGKEDVDYYKFQVEAGAALTLHVICQRLLNKLTEVTSTSAPIITLKNANGTVLASNDFFFGGDGLLHHRFAAAGEYFLEIRDVRYEGARHWQYAIEVHERPFVATISPACLPPGVATKVRLIGYNLPDDPFVTVTLPADALPWDQWLTLPDVGGKRLNAVLVRPSELPDVGQAAKLANSDGASLAVRSTLLLPSAVAGVLDRTGAVDTYAFQAKKGERLTFQIAARPLNSALDSVLRILDAKGETLAENDDTSDRTGHKDRRNELLCADSRIENWEVPADGRYFVEVSDVHGRGGARFTYSLLARLSQPHFRLELNGDRTILAPGTTGVLFVRAVRKEGFTGDIDLKVDGLPPGVAAVCGSIPAPCQDGCILLRCEDAKPRTFGMLRVFGTAATSGPEKSTPAVRAQPYGELMRDGGSRGLVPTNDHVVSVVDAADVRAIRFSPSEIALKPGETKTVEVAIERRPGFQGAVTLAVTSNLLGSVFGNVLPEGVTLDPSSQIRLTGNQLTGALVFKAAPTARPVRRQLVPVMGEVSVNFTLRMLHGGDPLWLTVEAAP
jgi:hypothetical protein